MGLLGIRAPAPGPAGTTKCVSPKPWTMIALVTEQPTMHCLNRLASRLLREGRMEPPVDDVLPPKAA